MHESIWFAGPLDAMLRGLVLGKLGRCGEEKTVAEANKRFKAHIDGSKTLAADLRTAVCNINNNNNNNNNNRRVCIASN